MFYIFYYTRSWHILIIIVFEDELIPQVKEAVEVFFASILCLCNDIIFEIYEALDCSSKYLLPT